MVMGARGRDKRVLLPGEGRNFIEDMAWAPGAGRVVLVMEHNGVSDLWMYTLATGRLHRLHVQHHPDRFVMAVDWSRSGMLVFSAIDFSDGAREDFDLYFVRPDGSGLRQLTNTHRRLELSPRFSPNGRRLVYTAYFGQCGYLVVGNSDGTNRRGAGLGCNDWSAASWSPDSRRLLVQLVDRRTFKPEIWAMTVGGSFKRFIVAGNYATWRPR